ncbi:MAG: glycerol kinase GlpK [Candidatus Omnitrophica bacterium]|nr:glycerol kinase GlpK [Candidatus Omnitrophota bacterium]
MVKYILAIDQGTTGNRAVIYDKNGTEKASAYQEYRQYFPRPGWVEHNPKEIWKGVNYVIQKALAKIPYGSIAAIGISNQRETTIVWDKNTGKPVYNAIVWQCRRTSKRCDELKQKKGSANFFRKRTGLPIDAYFSATKIEWILDNVPGVYRRAKSGTLLFGTPDTWVLWKMTGGATHATDYTNASRTMLFNIEKLKWDRDILRKFHVPIQMLPQVLPSSGVFGRTVKIGRLPAGIPIAGIAGDQQAALFGQTCFDPGNMKNTYGTGSFVLINAGQKRPFSTQGLVVTLGCGPSGEPVYIIEGSIFVSGSAVQWLRDGIRIIPNAADSEKMAKSLKSNEGVYFVPAMVGLGAPYWDQYARGSIYGLTRGINRCHFVRAALEAMCYQTMDVLLAMKKDYGHRIKEIRVDGKASENNFVCQFQADILDINVVRPKIIETTSLGAAYLAGLAVGYWKDTDEIKKCWKKDRTFKPRMPRKLAKTYYAQWKKAVKRTLSDYLSK